MSFPELLTESLVQVHPKHFTEGLLHAARERCGTSVRVGEVQAICLDADMRVTGERESQRTSQRTVASLAA